MKTIGSQSFDQKIKRLFFLHWEKVVVALALLGIAAFCWFGYVKPYDKTNPNALRKNVEEAQSYIQNANSWTEIASFRKANDQTVEVISAEETIEHEPYNYANLLGTKAATRGLRFDPEIKVPMEPQARVVVGTVLIKRPEDAKGVLRRDWWSELVTIRLANRLPDEEQTQSTDDDLEIAGKRQRPVSRTLANNKKVDVVRVPAIMRTEFTGLSPAKLGLSPDDHTSLVVSAVAVTGLFPHELQAKEYERFTDAIKYNELRDQPYYVYLQVERRKRANGQESEWQDITKYVTEDLLNNVYAATAPEIVEEPYVDRYLTVKIPPFVWMDYKTFATTAKVPVIAEKTVVEEELVVGVPKKDISLEDFNRSTETQNVAVDEPVKKELSQYKLIRFFDLSATANEEVQYRFRVWLADPNDPKRQVYDRVWNKQQADLASGEATGAEGSGDGDSGMRSGQGGKGRGGALGNTLANAAVVGNAFELTFMDVDPEVRKRLKAQEAQPEFPEPLKFLKNSRPSEWSEPTEWVRIPQANSEVVAGRVETGLQQSALGVTYFDDEPLVNVVVKKWDPALQVQIPVARKVFRGTVMNFRSPAKVINPVDREIYDVTRELIEDGTVENGVKFETNAFVVDMLGGQKMPFSTAEKAYYEPSEILVMRDDGTLEVRDELGDRMEYRHGVYADDELLTDVAPVTKEEAVQDEGELGSRGSRAGGKGRLP